MNRVRGLVLLLACSPLVLVSPMQLSASTGAERDDVVPRADTGARGWNGIQFRDRAQPALWYSFLKGIDRTSGSKPCTSSSEGECATNQSQRFQSLLPRCTTAESTDCISDFGLVTASGARTSASFSRSLPTTGTWDFAAEPALGLPAGSTSSLWTIPDAPHNGGSDYLLRVRVEGSRSAGSKFSFSDFDVSLNAVKLVEQSCTSKCIESLYYNEGQNMWAHQGGAYSETEECIGSSEKITGRNSHYCAARRRIPLDATFFVTVRLSQTPVGWLHGRLDTAKITINPSSNGTGATVDIQGGPVAVPIVVTGRVWSELPPNLQAAYSNAVHGYMWPGSKNYGGSFNSLDIEGPAVLGEFATRRIDYKPSPAGPPGIAELKAWLPLISDTATANVSTWGVRTLNSTEMSGVSNCFTKDKTVSGIVTTNATQYSAGPPTLNSTTGSLDYQVAAPHYTSGGAVFKGSYKLVMRSDVARCLYGFSRSPIKATVAVIEEDGDPSAATTTVSEADGWLQLSASGFTHSAPTIRATITGEYAATKTLKLRAKRTMSLSTLTRSARVSVPKKAKVRMSVVSSSRRICRIEKSTVRALKKGTCEVTVSVTAQKKTTRTMVTISVR